jgi:hypothetical protein
VLSGGGSLILLSVEPASVSVFLHVVCNMIGGVERWLEGEIIQS